MQADESRKEKVSQELSKGRSVGQSVDVIFDPIVYVICVHIFVVIAISYISMVILCLFCYVYICCLIIAWVLCM